MQLGESVWGDSVHAINYRLSSLKPIVSRRTQSLVERYKAAQSHNRCKIIMWRAWIKQHWDVAWAMEICVGTISWLFNVFTKVVLFSPIPFDLLYAKGQLAVGILRNRFRSLCTSVYVAGCCPQRRRRRGILMRYWVFARYLIRTWNDERNFQKCQNIETKNTSKNSYVVSIGPKPRV